MELIYLWIEKYKNIENEGFIFTPEFECDFNKDSKELIINKKDNYKTLFPKNINITAIVGENGSGKSSVLIGITDFKAIFKINDQYYCRGFEISKVNAPFNIIECDIDIKEYLVYLDYDLIKINTISNAWDHYNQSIYDQNLYLKVENNTVGSLDFNIAKFRENFFNLIIKYEEDFKADIFTFNPKIINLNDHIFIHNTDDPLWEDIYNFVDENRSILTKNNFLIFIYYQVCHTIKYREELGLIESIDDLIKIEDKLLNLADYFGLVNIDLINGFFKTLDTFENKEEFNINEFRKIYQDHNEAFLNLVKIGYLQVNLKDYLDREYFSLSQGERKFFSESLMIFDSISKNRNSDILIVLDEPDITLHPQWQKKYLREVTNILSYFQDKKFHLVITSHSPFILSDLPKENVIFLSDGKQAYPEIETFGSNIHTLLSHGFFMKNGFMGEFAKAKIDELIEYLNNNPQTEIQNNEEAQYRINMIGEPILKQQLQKMLDSKRLTKIDRIDLIEEQIKELSSELEQLKDG